MGFAMAAFLTLDDLRLPGTTVLLRLDVNSPIVNGGIAGTERIEASAETLRELVAKKARVVVLGHQGRKGGDDFTSLREHADLLGKTAGVPLRFVEDVAGPAAASAIKGMKDGEAICLENVRGLDDETRKASPDEYARAPFVKTLASLAQSYVNDAFSASHRNQASLVGFPRLLPAAAGRTMERELLALAKATEESESPCVYVLGGAKPEDSIAVMKRNLAAGKLDLALTCGLVGELFLVARGNDLGKPTMQILEKKGVLAHLPEAEALLDAYDEHVITPQDVAVKTETGARKDVWIEELPENLPILDIGPEALAEYRHTIADAASVMLNGPAGLYEEPPFDRGTRGILEAVAETPAFTLLGGGHTNAAIEKFGLDRERFGYVSLAGGALVAYLSGEPLPAVEALKDSKTRFGRPRG
ncbi:MAG: phosphoglycerate kinase [Methanobacteriota archaeon]